MKLGILFILYFISSSSLALTADEYRAQNLAKWRDIKMAEARRAKGVPKAQRKAFTSYTDLESKQAVRDIYKIMENRRKLGIAKKNKKGKTTCFNDKLGNRGRLNNFKGYLKGMALTMVRVICRSDDDPIKIQMLAGNGPRMDALYRHRDSSEKKQIIEASILALSLGLWETSSRFYLGRDRSNSSSGKSLTVEAGLFQSSMNIHILRHKGNRHPWHLPLRQLEEDYWNKPEACMADIFAQDMKWNSLDRKGNPRKNQGTGEDGFVFQSLLRTCPAAAAEHIRMTMRFNLRNHGPLRRYASKGSNHKKTETRGLMNSCRPLFEEVYDYAEQNKEAACEALAF